MRYQDIVQAYAKIEAPRKEVCVHAISYFNPFKDKSLVVSAICKYNVDIYCDYAYIAEGKGYRGYAPSEEDEDNLFYSTSEEILVYKVMQCILKHKGLWKGEWEDMYFSEESEQDLISISTLEDAIKAPAEVVPEIKSLEDLDDWLSEGEATVNPYSKRELQSVFVTLSESRARRNLDKLKHIKL